MINFDLNNKVAIITGGAQGFGFAISERFVKSGAKVVIWDIDKDAAEHALKKLNSKNASYKLVDVNKFDEIEKNLSEIEKTFGKIDIFINNAGIAGMNTTVSNYPIEEWKKIIDLNLNSVFYCCKAVVPYMEKNNYGRIVNIASVSGKDGNANASAYSSSKAAVIGLTKSLGKELALNNIAVNVVTPAGANTRILNQMSKEHVQRMLSKVPKGRFLEVNELTSMVCWLSSEENSFSTAAVFDISGGRSTY